MTDEQWLRERLVDAVPEPPQVPDRARRAAARARRRRTTAAASVEVAAILAVVGVGVTLLGGGDDSAPPASDPTPTTDSSPVPVCPPAPRAGTNEPPDTPDPSASLSVPGGATSARLCQGIGSPFQVPDDALVRGADELVRTVNGLDQLPEPVYDCDPETTDEVRFGFRIAFGYADGSQFVTSGSRYGCGNLVVGSSARAEAREVFERFVDLLRDQRDAGRSATHPPADAHTDCTRYAGESPVLRPTDPLVSVSVCERVGRGPEGPVGSLSRAQVAAAGTLADSADPESRSPSCPPWAGDRDGDVWAVATTVWDEKVQIYRTCGIWRVIGADPESEYTLRDDSPVAAVLDEVAGLSEVRRPR